MKPVLVVQQIAVHKMICVSDPQLLLSTESTVNAEDVESRRHDVWDDDEDEDY